MCFISKQACANFGAGYFIVNLSELSERKRAKQKTTIDNLKIFSDLANVADVKSLVIHPGTTTHSQLSEEELESQGIGKSTVRLSIGTEHIDDLLADIKQAFAAI